MKNNIKDKNKITERSRNPFEYGQQVARRRYSEIMAGLDAQRMKYSTEVMGTMYQEARQRAVRNASSRRWSVLYLVVWDNNAVIMCLQWKCKNSVKLAVHQQQAMADLYTQQQVCI